MSLAPEIFLRFNRLSAAGGGGVDYSAPTQTGGVVNNWALGDPGGVAGNQSNHSGGSGSAAIGNTGAPRHPDSRSNHTAGDTGVSDVAATAPPLDVGTVGSGGGPTTTQAGAGAGCNTPTEADLSDVGGGGGNRGTNCITGWEAFPANPCCDWLTVEHIGADKCALRVTVCDSITGARAVFGISNECAQGNCSCTYMISDCVAQLRPCRFFL